MVAKKKKEGSASSSMVKAVVKKDKSTPKESIKKAKKTLTKDKIVGGKNKQKNLSGNRKGKKPALGEVVPAANVIYIGHIPDGCEERELIGFLKQFGVLTQLRLCRSQKTGGSKGYAFAKFHSPDVAAIVADTLNGHLLFQKRLISHVLAPEQIHGKLFTASKATRTIYQRRKLSSNTTTPAKSMEKMEEISKRLIERERNKRDKLKELGIDYDFPGYEGANNDNKKEKKKKKKKKKEQKQQKQKQQKEQEESKRPQEGEPTEDKNDDNNDDNNGSDDDVVEKEEKRLEVKKSKKGDTPTSGKPTSPKKRKHSFDEDVAESPEDTTSNNDPEKSQSEKKKSKKKKKKDKKRRKSVP